jgi:hypothetical protein
VLGKLEFFTLRLEPYALSHLHIPFFYLMVIRNTPQFTGFAADTPDGRFGRLVFH